MSIIHSTFSYSSFIQIPLFFSNALFSWKATFHKVHLEVCLPNNRLLSGLSEMWSSMKITVHLFFLIHPYILCKYIYNASFLLPVSGKVLCSRLKSNTSLTSGNMWARLEVMMTPPPKHMRHERTLPILESPSFSFLLSQPLLTEMSGIKPMIQVANPAKIENYCIKQTNILHLNYELENWRMFHFWHGYILKWCCEKKIWSKIKTIILSLHFETIISQLII